MSVTSLCGDVSMCVTLAVSVIRCCLILNFKLIFDSNKKLMVTMAIIILFNLFAEGFTVYAENYYILHLV